MSLNVSNYLVKHVNGTTFNLYDKTKPCTVVSAKQSVDLLGGDTIDISVKSGVPIAFNIGDKITVIGRDYTLNTPAKEKKQSETLFMYDLHFEGVQYDLLRASYNVNVDTTNGNVDTTNGNVQDLNGDSLTGDIKIFLDVLIANANRVFGAGKWTLGTYPAVTKTVTLTFSDQDNCLSVLQSLCTEDNFNNEFDIVVDGSGNATINIGEVGKLFTYTFEYGKGKGIYELTRDKLSSSNIITRLYCYGSSKNIITSKYRAAKLCLAGKGKALSYLEDSDAIAKYGVWESTKNYEDIYPEREGTVTGLGSSELEMFDSSMDFDLNAKDGQGNTLYMLAGTSPKIHFNTGDLAGYEFELSAYDHATKKFYLIPTTDANGYTFPSPTSEAFKISIGDKYTITDIYMPQTYVDAGETKLQTRGLSDLNKYKQPLVQYSLTLEALFLKNIVGADAESNIVGVGDYIPIKDDDINVDKSIRVKGFTRDLLLDYSYSITIADLPVTVNTISRVITAINGIDKIIKINNLNDPARARRNWKDSQEILNMVFDPEGDLYTDKIKPLSIETTMLSVGAKSMQFSLEGTIFQPTYAGANNRVVYAGGTLTHYAILDVNSNPRTWTIADGDVTLTTDSAHYVYAKCARAGAGASILFSASKITTESDPDYYHFLIGILNSVDSNNARSLGLMYGFTTVNGRFIKTGRITSADGNTYFDLDAGEFTGNFKFTSGTSVDTEISDSKNDAISTAAADATAKAAAAQAAAQSYAEAKATLAETTAKAHADGIVTASEQRSIDDATAKANAAQAAAISTAAADATAKAAAAYANAQTFVNSIKTDLQSQIDGNITSWFFDYEPNLTNVPASNWDQEGVKDIHLGDLFYYTSKGYSYRFQKVGSTFSWTRISDTDVTKALADAAKAQDTADGKRRVFVSQPTTPYDLGDLWSQGSAGDLMKCIVARASGSFVSGDWDKAVKYTDDTTANKLLSETSNLIPDGDDFSKFTTKYATVGASNYPNKDGVNNATMITCTQQVQDWDLYKRANGLTEGKKYTIYLWVKLGTATNFVITPNNTSSWHSYNCQKQVTGQGWQLLYTTFTAESNGAVNIHLGANQESIAQTAGTVYLCGLRMVEGIAIEDTDADATAKANAAQAAAISTAAADATAKAAAAQAAAQAQIAAEISATAYLKAAMQGSTDISGGLVATNVMQMKNSKSVVTAGMSGLSTDNIGVWAGGTYADAISAIAKCILRKDGSGQLAGNKIKWSIDGNLQIGDMYIDQSGAVCIQDTSAVKRVIIARNEIATLYSIAYSSQNTTVQNDGYYYSDNNNLTVYLPNQITASNNSSVLAITAQLYADSIRPLEEGDGYGSSSIIVSLQNVATLEEFQVGGCYAYCNNYSDSQNMSVSVSNTVAAGTYRIKLDMHNDADGNCAGSVSITNVIMHMTFDGSLQRTEIGKNGIGIIGNANNYSFFGSEGGVFKSVEKVSPGGVYDKPGVLACGTIASDGGQSGTWGAKVNTANAGYTATGKYNVVHNVGSTAYQVILIPIGDNCHAFLTAKSNYGFSVQLRNNGGGAMACAFDYVIVGSN